MSFTLTGNQISHWVVLSRIHGLALEINTNGQMRTGSLPVLKMLEVEGYLPNRVRNTQLNRCMTLRSLVADYLTVRPDYTPGRNVCEALI